MRERNSECVREKGVRVFVCVREREKCANRSSSLCDIDTSVSHIDTCMYMRLCMHVCIIACACARVCLNHEPKHLNPKLSTQAPKP